MHADSNLYDSSFSQVQYDEIPVMFYYVCVVHVMKKTGLSEPGEKYKRRKMSGYNNDCARCKRVVATVYKESVSIVWLSKN